MDVPLGHPRGGSLFNFGGYLGRDYHLKKLFVNMNYYYFYDSHSPPEDDGEQQQRWMMMRRHVVNVWWPSQPGESYVIIFNF